MSDNPYKAAPIEQERPTNKSPYLSIVLALGLALLFLVCVAAVVFYMKLGRARLMEQKALDQAEQATKLAEEIKADLEIMNAR